MPLDLGSIGNVLNQTAQGLSNTVNNTTSTVTNVITNPVSTVTDIVNNTTSTVTTVVNTVIPPVVEIVNTVVPTVTDIVNNTTSTVTDIVNTTTSTIGDILGGGTGGGGSGSGGGITVGPITTPLPAIDTSNLLGGLPIQPLTGLVDVHLLNQNLAGVTLQLNGLGLFLDGNTVVGGALGTEQADIITLGANSSIANIVLGGGDDQVIPDDLSIVTGILDGGAGNDELGVGLGNATVDGGSGNDYLFSVVPGNNEFDGGEGADTMAAGYGDDTYIVDNSGDQVIEYNNQGNDTVRSSVNYSAAG